MTPVISPRAIPRWIVAAFAATCLAGFAAVVVAADRSALPHVITRLYDWPGGDKAGHVILLGLLTFVVDLALAGRLIRIRRWMLPLAAVFVAAGITLEEASQAFFPARTLSVADLACSYLGIYLATRAATAVHRRPSRLAADEGTQPT